MAEQSAAVAPGILRHPALLIAACAIGLAISIGPVFVSTFSTFIIPLQQDLGWSRGDLSMLYTVQGIALVVTTFFLGPVIARVGPRKLIAVSALLFALCLLGLAILPTSYWLFVIWAGMIGAAGAGTNSFAYLTLLPQWFTRRLGLVFGVAMTGVGLGQLLMPMIAQRLTAELGWRGSYAALAGIAAVAAPLALIGLRENPAYRRSGAAEVQPDPGVPGLTLAHTVRTRTFWLLWISFFLLSLAFGGVAVHLAPLLIDRGMPAAEAASLVGLTGFSVLVFRFLGGYLLDRIGTLIVGALAFGASTLAPLTLLPGLDPWLMVLAPLLVGLAVGVEGDVMPYVSRERFGMKSYGLIYSRMFLSMMAGPIVGAAVAGQLFDLTGSYTLGLWIFAGVSLLSLLVFILGVRGHRPEWT